MIHKLVLRSTLVLKVALLAGITVMVTCLAIVATSQPSTSLAAPLATSHTTTLFTPPLVPEGDNTLDCYLVNVSDKARQVKIEAFTKEGVSVAVFKGTIKPGQEEVAKAGASALPRYCKFVVEGERADFRGSILVEQKGVGSISALSAQ